MEKSLNFEAEKNKLLQEIFSTNDTDDTKQTIQQIEFKIQINQMLKNQDLMTAFFDYQDKEEIMMFCQALMDGGIDDFVGMLHEGMSKSSIKLSNIFETLLKSDLKNEVPLYIEHIPLEGKEFYENMKMLRNLAKNRLQMTAAKEMAKEKILHKIYLANLKNQEKIKVIQEKIEEHETQFQEILSEKYAKIERYKHDIEMLKEQSKDEIAKHIYESDKVMLRQCKISDSRQNELRENVDTSREKYQKTLENNLRTEKQLREKKVKITQQLQQWIAKYDVDVGTRTRELEDLTEKLDAEEMKFKKWLDEEFEPQEKNYKFLMEEKEEEERRLLEEKLWMFMMNRAAKILQRYWRALVIKRKTKKGKKGRKGKK